jgi:hypothetical protein
MKPNFDQTKLIHADQMHNAFRETLKLLSDEELIRMKWRASRAKMGWLADLFEYEARKRKEAQRRST